MCTNTQWELTLKDRCTLSTDTLRCCSTCNLTRYLHTHTNMATTVLFRTQLVTIGFTAGAAVYITANKEVDDIPELKYSLIWKFTPSVTQFATLVA